MGCRDVEKSLRTQVPLRWLLSRNWLRVLNLPLFVFAMLVQIMQDEKGIIIGQNEALTFRSGLLKRTLPGANGVEGTPKYLFMASSINATPGPVSKATRFSFSI